MSLDDRVVAILDRVDALCRHLGVPGYVPSQGSSEGSAETKEAASKRWADYIEERKKAQADAEEAMKRQREAQGKTDEVDEDDRERLEGSWML